MPSVLHFNDEKTHKNVIVHVIKNIDITNRKFISKFYKIVYKMY